jgi:hypothetical protein
MVIKNERKQHGDMNVWMVEKKFFRASEIIELQVIRA